MELPDVGKHCSKQNCNKLDFLPIKCDVCLEIFCADHHLYASHDCRNAYLRNNQVPVCPLCNIPIPVGLNQEPDRIVGAHIDNDCQSDPAINKRKVFTNKCSLKGCKMREIISLVCQDCGSNYCLKHRHPLDHQCKGESKSRQQKNAAKIRQNVKLSGIVQDNMSEDEALARALALSLQDEAKLTQEELDRAFARQMHLEYQKERAGTSSSNSQNKTCTLS